MENAPRRDWKVIGCAALLGAAIALPAGLIIGNYRAQRPAAEVGTVAQVPGDSGARSRNIYAPQFRSDPYVIEQQRRVADALAVSCRQARQHCQEAEQARQRIREAEAGR